MDDITPHAFANRDEALPVLNFDATDDASDDEDGHDGDAPQGKPRKRDRIKKHLSKGNLKAKLGRATGNSISMQERMLEK